ncbi:hypothetical protein VPH35_075730 [Triticum aestivum]
MLSPPAWAPRTRINTHPLPVLRTDATDNRQQRKRRKKEEKSERSLHIRPHPPLVSPGQVVVPRIRPYQIRSDPHNCNCKHKSRV